MKLFLILPLLVTVVTAQFGGFGGLGQVGSAINRGVGSLASRVQSLPVVNNVANFADFAAQTGKTYADAAERTLRENLFTARKSLVDANNAAFAAGGKSYELAVNAFADLTSGEFLSRLTGNKKSAQGESKAKAHRQLAKPKAGPVPDSWDWREKGGVTPVKFQGECGSCWTFATTGAIEGHIFRKTGKLISLSEQNLVDCGKEDFGLVGCDGGFQEYAFEFITSSQKGIAFGDKYPYLDKKDKCSYQNGIKGAEIKGFAAITPKDEKTMKEVIATLGPLACSLNGLESLLLYKKGIYADEECNKGEVNHSVLVVGYGSENGQDYWIVKNSWDKNWGEDGYFRLPRGNNFCGIAMECSYPVV
ncbi:procathepsin L [Teleopsis dalmanni]|uniref:procathepsin L n=1 Tax=Teleopsis dalmanni TaxID=139649 RepID=UPI0018CF4F67|nr:procathepsin L [Teleopsis dalmanni]